MFQRLLVCTDFTDGMYRLVSFVPSLAAGGVRQITFLHVIPPSGERIIPQADQKKIDEARDRLSPALANLPDGVDVKVEVRSGSVVEQILQCSKAYQPEAMLMGLPYRSRIDQQLFGSTTRQICQRLNLPILIFRPQLMAAYTTEELDLRCRHLFRFFLIPYDNTPPSVQVIQSLKQIAPNRLPNSLEQCLLCWVVDSVTRVEAMKPYEVQQAEEKLAAVKTDLSDLGLAIETTVQRGNPINEVLALAEKYDISAIALSSDNLGRPFNIGSPGFTPELMQRSWHPILYFPLSRK